MKHNVLLADWQAFYCAMFGLELDFSNLIIPEKQAGFDRLLIIAYGMTPQQLYDKCKKLFPCWKYAVNDLDNIVTSSRTTKNAPYAICVRNRIEADEELKNLSANDLKSQSIPGITLEERLIYELKFFKETSRHLDIQNVTLCSGSRYGNDDDVPGANWNDGKFKVYWYLSDNAYNDLRSRQVVS